MDPQSKNLFQLIQDRNAGQTITYLALSTKQDLVAYATVKGEVLIYNSDWMKVANYKALSFLTGENVSFLAWRPDGRGKLTAGSEKRPKQMKKFISPLSVDWHKRDAWLVDITIIMSALAIAYSTGRIMVKNVETHETVAELKMEDPIKWLDWSPSYWTAAEMASLEERRLFKDRTERYLQDVMVPKLGNSAADGSKDFVDIKSQLQMKNQRTLSILSIITSSYGLHLYAFGFLPLAYIDPQESLQSKISQICDYSMSRDFQAVVLIVRDEANVYWELVYDISIIQRHFEEIEILSKHSDYLWSYRKAIENYFKRLSSVKDESRQELEEKIKKLVLQFEKEWNDAKAIRPELAVEESPAQFLLAALIEQLVIGTVNPELEIFFEHIAPTQDLVKYESALDQSLKAFRTEVMLPFRRALECCLVSLTILGRWVANEERFAAVGAVRSYFDQVVQDCASFMLKMFELQYMTETESKRCLTAIQWLITQSEIINHEAIVSSRKQTEDDLDDVVGVFQQLLGSVPVNVNGTEMETDAVPEWRMRFFGIDPYFQEADLPEPFDLQTGDFQPFYEAAMGNGHDGSAPEEERSFLGEHARIKASTPMKTLFVHRPEKSARQELTTYVNSLEMAFANIIAVVSREISLVRKHQIIDNTSGKIIASIYPVPHSASLFGQTDKQSAATVQIVYSESLPCRSITILEHAVDDALGEDDCVETVHIQDVVAKKYTHADPEIVDFCQMATAGVFFVKSKRDGDISLVPHGASRTRDRPMEDTRVSVNPRATPPEFLPLNLSSGMNLFAINALGTVLAVVSNESRLRVLRINGSPEVEIVDDTDRIAQELTPDLSAIAH